MRFLHCLQACFLAAMRVLRPGSDAEEVVADISSARVDLLLPKTDPRFAAAQTRCQILTVRKVERS